MAADDACWEDELQEQFSLLSASSTEVREDGERSENTRGGSENTRGGSDTGILHLSEEVLVLILRGLDPTSLLRVGGTCRTLFRVCSCNSLWTRHFQASFGVPFVTATCSPTAKAAFRQVFMWRTLFRNLHCNRSLQERLFAQVPSPPQRYWSQWLVLEGAVPLPPVRLPASDIQALWGVEAEVLKEKAKVFAGEEEEEEVEEKKLLLELEWKELYSLAVEHHGGLVQVYRHVLNQQHGHDHTELETLFHQYTQCRFQWLFCYWLFRQPPPYDYQLRSVFLQWRRHCRRKVATWGETLCDVRYLASLHPITADYWRGKLAQGDETAGIQSVDNYFSMCRSLVAWILGRDWGRLKRRKVYKDTLEGVYLVLRRELQESVVGHHRLWQVAKVQMARVCTLEETAINYVNWRMIESLPYYKLYMVSGNPAYLSHIQGFLRRKRLVHDWIHLEENCWVRQLLPEALYSLLERYHKIPQDSLHGDSACAQMSRVVWLYLNSGQQLYLEAVKGLVLQCARAGLPWPPQPWTGLGTVQLDCYHRQTLTS